MSDEEDTAILLSNVNNGYKEITVVIPMHGSPKKHHPRSLHITATTVATFLAGFVYGYDMPNVLCYLAEYANTFQLSCIYQSFLLAAWAAGGIVGLFIGAALSLQCRRNTMLCSTSIVTVGTLLVATSPCTLLVYGGRALVGLGCVFSASAHCCYIGELSDGCVKSRGFRITCHQFGVSVGVFVCLIASYFFKASENGWRYATALNLIPIVLHVLLCSLFVPKDASTSDDRRPRANNCHPDDHSLTTVYGSFLALFIITLGAQLSGRQSILSYAPTAFIQLGIDPINAQQSVSITVSIVRMICTGIALNIIDKLGRKPTLLMSMLIMFTSGVMLLILLPADYFNDIKTNVIKYGDYCPYFRLVDSTGVFTFGAREQQMQLIGQDMARMFVNNDQSVPSSSAVFPPFPMLPTPLSLVDGERENAPTTSNTSTNVLAVIIILVFEAAHALGPSTVVSVLAVEMLPSERRCSGFMCVASIYWLFDMGFSVYLSIFTQYFSDQVFNKDFFECSLVVCIITTVIVQLLLSETKCKTLEEIQMMLYNDCYLTAIIDYMSTMLYNNADTDTGTDLRRTRTSSRRSMKRAPGGASTSSVAAAAAREPVQETVI